jgi:hypothetical protein
MNNSNLINSDITIVRPDPVTGKLEFRDLGNHQTQCSLSCHGKVHCRYDCAWSENGMSVHRSFQINGETVI